MYTVFAIFLTSICSIEAAVDLSPGERQQTEKQLLYAEQLFDARIYNSSILEYKRFLFYQPHTELADFARYRIAQGHYYQGNRGYSQQLFREFMESFPDSPLYHRAQLMLGKTHLDDQEYATARSIFFQILKANDDERLLVQAQYLRGWCYVHDRNWFKAIAEFRRVHQLRGENRDTGLFDSDLEQIAIKLADTTLASTPLPLKSPKFAQLLSTVVPGSGQIYAGKVRNGLISLAINTAFFYLLTDSVVDRRYVDAVGIYLVGSRFYWGNRFSAKKWAIEHNQDIEMGFIERLKSIEHEVIE